MKMWMKPLALGAVLALATTACESGTEPDGVDDDALQTAAALVAADGMFQDLNLMQSPGTWGGQAPGGPGFVPIEVEGGTSFSRTVTFTPCDGGPEDRYDPLLTSSMHIVASHTRSVQHTFWTADVQRQRDMIVSGMCDREEFRFWDGTSSGIVDKSKHHRDGSTRDFDMTTSAIFTAVKRGVPRENFSYPLGGTIERTVNATLKKNDEIVREKHITFIIEFNGTNLVTMTDKATKETWEVDLSLRGVRGHLKKRP